MWTQKLFWRAVTLYKGKVICETSWNTNFEVNVQVPHRRKEGQHTPSSYFHKKQREMIHIPPTTTEKNGVYVKLYIYLVLSVIAIMFIWSISGEKETKLWNRLRRHLLPM